jgi:hypothetical protein
MEIESLLHISRIKIDELDKELTEAIDHWLPSVIISHSQIIFLRSLLRKYGKVELDALRKEEAE